MLTSKDPRAELISPACFFAVNVLNKNEIMMIAGDSFSQQYFVNRPLLDILVKGSSQVQNRK